MFKKAALVEAAFFACYGRELARGEFVGWLDSPPGILAGGVGLGFYPAR
jgi:hypothetical protein